MNRTLPPPHTSKFKQFFEDNFYTISYISAFMLLLILIAAIIGFSTVSINNARESDNERLFNTLTEQFCETTSHASYRLTTAPKEISNSDQGDAYAYWKSPETGLWEPINSQGSLIETGGSTPITPPSTKPLSCKGN